MKQSLGKNETPVGSLWNIQCDQSSSNQLAENFMNVDEYLAGKNNLMVADMSTFPDTDVATPRHQLLKKMHPKIFAASFKRNRYKPLNDLNCCYWTMSTNYCYVHAFWKKCEIYRFSVLYDIHFQNPPVSFFPGKFIFTYISR